LRTGVGSIALTSCRGIKVNKQMVGATASGSIGDGRPEYKLSSGVGSLRVTRKR
jgi:hypothetical protein